MNDRRITALVATHAAAVLALIALLALAIVQHRASLAETRSIAQELRAARSARYEYKVITLAASAGERQGAEAAQAAMVTPGETELTSLGSAGWELVTSYLELETAYPNFGNDKYVTGLQPNIRPQRLVLVLRRRVA